MTCHSPSAPSLPLPKGDITVALTGQPNVGKSTVFNILTGLNQHVGNWPGKTIERRSGVCHYAGLTMTIVDLPGTYSLTANSQEELIAREYIITQRPDVVAAVVNAATLERSLYLVAELMGLDVPMVVGLNMMDVAREQGQEIDVAALEDTLGVPVVAMSAANHQGVHEFVQAIADVAQRRVVCTPHGPDIRADHQAVLAEIHRLIAPAVLPPYPAMWVALKLLEGDPAVAALMQDRLSVPVQQQVQGILRQHEDAALAIASGRYEWIERIVRAAVKRPRGSQVSLTARLDDLATHPVGGLAILAVMLALIFSLTYILGAPMQNWLSAVVVEGLAEAARERLAASPPWLSGVLIDGVLAGAGTVLTFLPILVVFFAALAVLEDVGYMARAAYVMDRFMHPMGLHGKSFLPLFLGFGCNVPAVQGTRIIEEPRARLLTILLAPLVPCAGRMAVVAFVAPIFFGPLAPLVSWGLIMGSVLIMAGLGLALSKTVVRGDPLAFIMELPLYHKPHLRTIGLVIWQRCLSFVERAGTLILIVSVIVWALSWLPHGDLETSILAVLGRLLEPLGSVMGMDWRMVVALLSSFVAKENSIATLGVLIAVGDNATALATALPAVLSRPAALAFLVVQVLFIPCVATIGAVRQETGSWRWTLFGVLLLLVVSCAAGIGVYRAARFMGW